MPSGEIHIRELKKMTPWVLLIVIIITGIGKLLGIQTDIILVFLGSSAWHWFLCGYIDPDLDQIGLTAAEGRMIRHFSYLGFLFAAWWTIYSYMANLVVAINKGKAAYSAHRSWFTHTLIPGTLFRALWLDLPIVAVMRIIYTIHPYHIDTKYIIVYLVAQFFIMCIGDGIHIVLDEMPLMQKIPQMRRRPHDRRRNILRRSSKRKR